MNTTELLIANGQLVADTLRHLADNEIDSDYFAITSTSENGTEIERELVITDYALQAASTVEALVEALESAQRKIAELEARAVTVKLPAHKYRECVNGLLEEAIAYAGTQQLRERLSSRLANFVQPDHPHTRCAAETKCEVKGE